ncbi:TPA: hypothetical protein ACH3X1_004432 [Trebouxia sp. C0004]
MASQEPLLQSEEHRPFRLRFPSLSFFHHWATGQPLRETESLDYEPIYNKVYFSRRKQPDRRFYGYTGHTLAKFFVTSATGLVTGLTAAACAATLEFVFARKQQAVQYMIDVVHHKTLYAAFGLHLLITTGLLMFAACLVQFWAPTAAGGGVSLVMAFLNGTDVPDLLRLQTLITKFVGSIFSCAANLTVGTEGPLVHMGACIASVIAFWECGSYNVNGKTLTFGEWMSSWCCCSIFRKERRRYSNGVMEDDSTEPPFHTDADHREFVSAGAAAGLAAAFGAPVGGVLFSMEEACTHWSRKVAWRCFLASAVSTFVLAQLHPKGYTGMLSFDSKRSLMYNRDWLFQMPLLIAVSLAAGLLGAAFNLLRRGLWRIRASRKRPGLRILEVFTCGFITLATIFMMSHFFGQCVQLPNTWMADSYGFAFTCPSGQYNDLATPFMSMPGDTIRYIFSVEGGSKGRQDYMVCNETSACHFTPRSLGLLSGIYLLLMALASGVAVPGGLFMPSIMVGASFGGMVGLNLLMWLPESWNIQPGVYAVVAATAVLAGVFRSSISLVVIVVEGTRGIDFLFGIIIAVVCANWIAQFVHKDGVYESELDHDGNVFFLRTEAPNALQYKTASDVMASPVVGFKAVERVDTVVEMLRTTKFNGFPVFPADSDIEAGAAYQDRLEGMIMRSQLLVLLQNQVFTDSQGRLLSGEVPSQRLEMQLDCQMRSFYRTRYMHRHSLASRPEVIDSLRMEDPVQQSQGQVDASTSGRQDAAENWARKARPGENEVVLLPVEATRLYLDLRPFMNVAPLAVRRRTVAARVHHIFQSLGLRHLAVVEPRGFVVGIITRKDLGLASHEQKTPQQDRTSNGAAPEGLAGTIQHMTQWPQTLIRQLSTSWANDPDADRSSTIDDAQSSLLSSRSPRWQTQDSQPRGSPFADDHDGDDLPQSDELLPEPSLREGMGEGYRHGLTEGFRDASRMSIGHRST